MNTLSDIELLGAWAMHVPANTVPTPEQVVAAFRSVLEVVQAGEDASRVISDLSPAFPGTDDGRTVQQLDAEIKAENLRRLGDPCERPGVIVSDVEAIAAGRELSRRTAEAGNANADDHWKLFGEECVEDARAILQAGRDAIRTPRTTEGGAA